MSKYQKNDDSNPHNYPHQWQTVLRTNDDKNTDRAPNLDHFDLEEFRRNTLAQKRENFWRRKGWQLSLISTVSMIVLFGIAYFLYLFLASVLADFLNF